MCDIMTANLPRDRGCLDERRFLLVIPVSLSRDERAELARKIFAEAGMEQDDQDTHSVTCLCGLDVPMPS